MLPLHHRRWSNRGTIHSKPIRLITEFQKRVLAAMVMLIRQRLGMVVMILFLPINGPLWRMGLESLGRPMPIGEFQFFVLSVLLFIFGAVITLAPKIKIG